MLIGEERTSDLGQLVIYRIKIVGPLARKGLVIMGQPVMYRTKIMGAIARKGLVIMG